MTSPALVKFLPRVEISDPQGCWLWTGARTKGYPSGRWNGGTVILHRLFYEEITGTRVAPDLTVDHLCFTPMCVNPLHMEVVSRGENTRRSNLRREYPHQDSCKYGHPLSGNLYVSPKGHRGCKLCRHERTRQHRARTKENQ